MNKLQRIGSYGVNWFRGYKSIDARYCSVSSLSEEETTKLISYLEDRDNIAVEFGGCKFNFEWAKCDRSAGQIYYTDGEFIWTSRLVHHIRKYNVKLPDCFVSHALSNYEKGYKGQDSKNASFWDTDNEVWKDWCEKELCQMSIFQRVKNFCRMVIYCLIL